LLYSGAMVSASELTLVACGGAFGATVRLLVGRLSEIYLTSLKFPLATLVVNIAGCFAIGCVAEIFARGDISHHTRLLIVTGVLGGFTTFSAFGLETITLLRSGHLGMAISYVLSSVIGGCLATYAGALFITPRS
jgi:CrcB protein